MQPSLEEVKQLQSQGNVIPVYKSVIADFLTPVSAFLKLEKDRSHAFLLESIEGGERIARYSFLGGDPFLIKRYRDGQPPDFMQNLRETMDRFKSVKVPNLPPFTGGAVGYFGYDMVRTIEEIPKTGVDDLGVDDAVLMFYKTVLAFDHLRHQIHIITNVIVDQEHESIDVQYQNAVEEIREIESLLRAPLEIPAVTRNDRDVAVRSNFEKKDYLDSVAKAKEYIAAGDIVQAVLSQLGPSLRKRLLKGMTWLADTGTGTGVEGRLDEKGRFRPSERGDFLSHKNAKALLESRCQEMDLDEDEAAEQRELLDATAASAFVHLPHGGPPVTVNPAALSPSPNWDGDLIPKTLPLSIAFTYLCFFLGSTAYKADQLQPAREALLTNDSSDSPHWEVDPRINRTGCMPFHRIRIKDLVPVVIHAELFHQWVWWVKFPRIGLTQPPPAHYGIDISAANGGEFTWL